MPTFILLIGTQVIYWNKIDQLLQIVTNFHQLPSISVELISIYINSEKIDQWQPTHINQFRPVSSDVD